MTKTTEKKPTRKSARVAAKPKTAPAATAIKKPNKPKERAIPGTQEFENKYKFHRGLQNQKEKHVEKLIGKNFMKIMANDKNYSQAEFLLRRSAPSGVRGSSIVIKGEKVPAHHIYTSDKQLRILSKGKYIPTPHSQKRTVGTLQYLTPMQVEHVLKTMGHGRKIRQKEERTKRAKILKKRRQEQEIANILGLKL